MRPRLAALFFTIALRRAVGGEDDLFLALVEGIEGMEEFVLSLHLAGNKLDIVHQHQIRLPVFDPELVHGPAGADGFDEVVDEFVSLDVENPGGRGLAADLVGDSVKEVGFA